MSRTRWCALAGLLALAAGCSSEPIVELAPAEGVVKINGQPAENIFVQFLPQVPEGAPAPTSTGVSDGQGRFQMITGDGQPGAVVGPCKVILSDMDEERPEQGQPMTRPPRIPPDYSILNPRTMQVEVQPGSQPFVIEVRS